MMIRYIFRLNNAMSSEQVTRERFAKNMFCFLFLGMKIGWFFLGFASV